MTKIILVRHGHVEGIDPPRFRGRTELPLTDLGVRQARLTAQRIERGWKPAAVYTSPMGRCVSTAEPIGLATGAPLQVLEGLNDLDYGAWQWRTYADVKAQAPNCLRVGFRRRTWSGFLTAIRCRIWPPAPPMRCAWFSNAILKASS